MTVWWMCAANSTLYHQQVFWWLSFLVGLPVKISVDVSFMGTWIHPSTTEQQLLPFYLLCTIEEHLDPSELFKSWEKFTVLLKFVLGSFGSTWYKLEYFGSENLSRENVLFRLASRQDCDAFSWLMSDVEGSSLLLLVPTIDRNW